MRRFKQNYKGRKCFADSADLNAIGALLSNIVQGHGILITHPDNPSMESPMVFEVDQEWIKQFLASSPENPTRGVVMDIDGEGSAAADTKEWTANDLDGVRVCLQTRTHYDHTASTPVLYGYYRTFTWDRMGRLYKVSAETRYVIDQPVIGNLMEE